MYFDSFSAFLNMGGHGLYVWLVYGVLAASLIWLVIHVTLARKKALKKANHRWAFLARHMQDKTQ